MSLVDKIDDLIAAGWAAKINDSFGWKLRVAAFLRSAGRASWADDFETLSRREDAWPESKETLIGFLEGIMAAEADRTAISGQDGIRAAQSTYQRVHSRRAFIVHGRDTEAKELVARFLERLGLEPIILHEQPNSGQTVMEKFEAHSDVGFAVVLLTPDDVGGLAADKTNLNGRARQNVILELGYFIGKLTRRRVCALYKQGVEIPSDFQGVLYVEFDSAGAWRTKLAQELVEAGFSISLEALLKS